MIGRDAPVAACQLPSVRLKSCNRRSVMFACLRIRLHAFLGSSRCPDLPRPGNIHSLVDDSFRVSRTVRATGDSTTRVGFLLLAFSVGIIHMAWFQSIS